MSEFSDICCFVKFLGNEWSMCLVYCRNSVLSYRNVKAYVSFVMKDLNFEPDMQTGIKS